MGIISLSPGLLVSLSRLLMLPDFPPWMLWTTVGLTALSVALFVWNFLATRPPPPDPVPLTVQPLAANAPAAAAPPRPAAPPLPLRPWPPSPAGPPAPPPRALRPPSPPPPAPPTAVPAADSPERRNAYRRVGNAVLVLAQELPARGKPRNAWVVD